MRSSRLRGFLALMVMATGLVVALPAALASLPADDTPVLLTPKGEHDNAARRSRGFDKLRDAYYASRLLGGDNPLSTDPGGGAPEARASSGASAARGGRGARQGGAWSPGGAQPDRAGRPHDQHVRGGVRPDRRAGHPQ